MDKNTTVNTEATGKTFFHIDDNGDTVSIKVEGKAVDLINLFANAMFENKDIKKVIELALFAIEIKEEEEAGDGVEEDSPEEKGEQK